MKRPTTRKLALRSQTLRSLTGEALGQIAGGNPEPVVTGFIMKDTSFVRTSGLVAPADDGR